MQKKAAQYGTAHIQDTMASLFGTVYIVQALNSVPSSYTGVTWLWI